MSDTLLAAIVAAAISGIAAFATQRTAARAAVKSTETTSRTDIEKEAFERAKSFYTDTIDRQDDELRDVRAELANERQQRAEETTALRRELATERRERAEETAQLRVELNTAKRTLRRLRQPSDNDDPKDV